MILIRARTMIVVALSIMIFTATASVLFGLGSAPAAFAAGEGFVISDNTAPTIFSSRVDYDMVEVLEGVPEITGASPEVFAFSSYEDVSFVIRGVDLEKLNSTGPSFQLFELAQGRSTEERSSALLGERLKERLGLEMPFRMPLVGSYSSRLEMVDVIGSFSTGTSLDDEMLVSLDAARFLSGMTMDKVSIIRVASSDPEWLAGLLSPTNARFTLFDLRTSKREVAIGETLSITVGVRNWGGATGTVEVMFSETGQVLKEATVSLDPSESVTVAHDIISQQPGERSVEISLSGDFPVKMYANFTVIQPYLKMSAPSKALLGSEFGVTVTKFSGEPAEGATVTFGIQSEVTDQAGNVALLASDPGIWLARATLSGYTNASKTIQVQDPSAFPAEFLPSIVDFEVLPDTIKESEAAQGVLSVTNGGSVGGWFQVEILVDLEEYSVVNISLAGMSSQIIRFGISGLSPGTHAVQAGDFSRSLAVEPWIAGNPDLVQLVLRYGSSTSLSSSTSIPIYQAAKISEGNVSVALFAIGAISALLSSLAIVSIYSKEIHEARRKLGILKTIGASGKDIRKMVFPQAIWTGLVGAGVGVTLGTLISYGISRSGVFMVFGHTLTLDIDIQLMIVVFLSAIAIGVLTALWSSVIASRESVIASIRGAGQEDQSADNVAEISDN